MNDNNLEDPQKKLIGWYEQSIPIRGCKFSLDELKRFYRELQEINYEFGRQAVSELRPDDTMTPEEWDKHKSFLLDDGFRLTVSITGHHHQQVYNEYESIFSDPNLPMPIKHIYFTNITAFRRNANNNEPRNKLSVNLDFSKPPLFDPTTILSNATPNATFVTVRGEDISYFHAVQRVVDQQLLSRRTWYGAIHRGFAYDIGMWFAALPLALILATNYADKWLPVGGPLETYRWAFLLYSVGVIAGGYRFLTSYAKWAFPVNVLTDNKDISYYHRAALGAFFLWMVYKAGDVVVDLLSVV